MSLRIIPKIGNGVVAKLVEKQMRNWQLARAQRLSDAPAQRPHVQDFITVSRQVGAGGSEIAARLADRLDWPLFDRDILHVMAGDDRLREQVYASMDEHDLGWVEESFRALMQSEFVRNDYFHQLTRTILALARQGRAIYLGRAADLILPRDRGLRVRIVAPRDMRAISFADRHDISLDKAEQEMDRIERSRADFIRDHFHIDATEQTRHDLIINLYRITPETAVDIVMTALEDCGIATVMATSGAANKPRGESHHDNGGS